MTNPFQVPDSGGRNARPAAVVALAALAAVGAAVAAVGAAMQPAEAPVVLEAAPPPPAKASSEVTAPAVPRMLALQPPQPGLAVTEIPTGSAEATDLPTASRAEPAPVQAPAPAESPVQAPVVAAREDGSLRSPAPREIPALPQAFAGVWAPSGEACVPRLNKRGLLPAVINPDGAYAGETSCAFSRGRQVAANRWTFAAACTGPRGRWKTTVRISTEGDRLTWSSKRGSQTYVRCGTSGLMRAGMARVSKAG